MILCSVCSKAEKKYCCPKCAVLYCSLSCFKLHKDSDTCSSSSSEKQQEQESPDGERTLVNPSHGDYHYATEDTVPQDKLQQLGSSSQLRQVLTNPHLREFLTTLDRSEEKGRLMRKAMREPLFVEFVDACLEAIGEGEKMKEMTDEEILKAVQDKIEEED